MNVPHMKTTTVARNAEQQQTAKNNHNDHENAMAVINMQSGLYYKQSDFDKKTKPRKLIRVILKFNAKSGTTGTTLLIYLINGIAICLGQDSEKVLNSFFVGIFFVGIGVLLIKLLCAVFV